MPEISITEAEKRVREMELIARQYLEQSNRMIRQQQNSRQNTRFEPARPRSVPPPETPPESIAAAVPEIPLTEESPASAAKARGSAFPDIDGEKLLILLLIVLLIKEKADIKVIAALGYLIF